MVNSLIARIRDNLAAGDDVDRAVDRAIDAMPQDFVIENLFKSHRAEVQGMLLTEYNEAEARELFWEEGFREGYEEGYEKSFKEGLKEAYEESVKLGCLGIALDMYDSGMITKKQAESCLDGLSIEQARARVASRTQ